MEGKSRVHQSVLNGPAQPTFFYRDWMIGRERISK